LQEGPPNYQATAAKFGVQRTTLIRRHQGKTKSRADYYESRQIMTNDQERDLVNYINTLTHKGIPPTPAMVRTFIYDFTKHEVGKNFVGSFVRKYAEELDSKYLAPIDLARKKADSYYSYSKYFELVKEKIQQYKVQPKNMYNMDEKGFLLGVCQKTKRVFNRQLHEQGYLKGAGQAGNRDWITVLATICADGTHLPPAIIYEGKSGDVSNSWLEDFDPKHQVAFFAASPNGWTNDELGRNWLERVFDRTTKKKARSGRSYRLLILDGHGSHVNMDFLEYAAKHKILVAIYPPHSTHSLQPLDISLFNPLANYYSQELVKFVLYTEGEVSLTKKDFWAFFWTAYNKAFTESNIKSGWIKSGLEPFDPEVVLKKLPKKRQDRTEPAPPLSDSIKPLSPKDTKQIRQLLSHTTSSASYEGKLLRATMWNLADRANTLEEANNNLKSIVDRQRKRVQRKMKV